MVKIIAGPTANVLRVIERDLALKRAKIARKVASASREVVTKIETPKPAPAGEGLSRAERKLRNRANRKPVVVPQTAPSAKTLRKRKASIK